MAFPSPQPPSPYLLLSGSLGQQSPVTVAVRNGDRLGYKFGPLLGSCCLWPSNSHLWRGFSPKVRTLPLCRAFQNQSLGLEGTFEVTQFDHHSVFTSLHHPSQRSCRINLASSREVCSPCISFLSLPLRQKAKQSIPVLSLAGCGDCVVLNEGVDH